MQWLHTLQTIISKFTFNNFNCLEMRRVACGFAVVLSCAWPRVIKRKRFCWNCSCSTIGQLVFFIGQYNLEMILPWIGFDLNSFEISKISKKKEKQLLWSLNPISQSKPNPQRLNFEETNKNWPDQENVSNSSNHSSFNQNELVLPHERILYSNLSYSA